ncbi:hypothetical protein Y888_11655 [Mixta calida B021323]|nr:hypothetical protein Y888_11655 [Mixta calida B021323]
MLAALCKAERWLRLHPPIFMTTNDLLNER